MYGDSSRPVTSHVVIYAVWVLSFISINEIRYGEKCNSFKIMGRKDRGYENRITALDFTDYGFQWNK